MQTLKNSSLFEFEASDSTKRRRRNGTEFTQRWLNHFCIWPNRRNRTSTSQSTFCPHTQMHLPINTGYAEIEFCNISRVQKFETYLHKRSKLSDSGGKWCRPICWCEKQKINGGLLSTANLMDVAQHSAGVSRFRPQLLFLHQKQNIRTWQQQFKKHCIWNNFWRISASNRHTQ